MFGVNEFDFLLSVCGNANFIEFISNAKSGQFFFYRHIFVVLTSQEFLQASTPTFLFAFDQKAWNEPQLMQDVVGPDSESSESISNPRFYLGWT